MCDYSRKPVHITLGTNAGPEHEHSKSPSNTAHPDQNGLLAMSLCHTSLFHHSKQGDAKQKLNQNNYSTYVYILHDFLKRCPNHRTSKKLRIRCNSNVKTCKKFWEASATLPSRAHTKKKRNISHGGSKNNYTKCYYSKLRICQNSLTNQSKAALVCSPFLRFRIKKTTSISSSFLLMPG